MFSSDLSCEQRRERHLYPLPFGFFSDLSGQQTQDTNNTTARSEVGAATGGGAMAMSGGSVVSSTAATVAGVAGAAAARQSSLVVVPAGEPPPPYTDSPARPPPQSYNRHTVAAADTSTMRSPVSVQVNTVHTAPIVKTKVGYTPTFLLFCFDRLLDGRYVYVAFIYFFSPFR